MKATVIPTSRLILSASAATLCALGALSTRTHASPPQYTVTVLGGVSVDGNGGIGISNSGQQVAGDYDVGFYTFRAVQWTGTNPTDLGTLEVEPGPDADASEAYAINNFGQVAGYSFHSGYSVRAVRWTGTIATDLGTLGGVSSAAYGINDSGQVAGGAELAGGSYYHAVRWTGTTPTELGTLGGNVSMGHGINASGQVAGHSNTAGDPYAHAVRWTGTTAEDLGDLGGFGTYGNGINASGQVAGHYSLDEYGFSNRAVRWTGTVPTDLGSLGGARGSEAYSINDSGDVVGESFISDVASVPFLYTGGTMYDLNSLLVSGSGVIGLGFAGRVGPGPSSLNNFGQITMVAGIGGQARAVRLDPVEPFTITNPDGTSRNAKFVAGMKYSLFPAFTTNGGPFATTVRFLDGTAAVNRDVTVASTGEFLVPGSDVIALSTPTPDPTNPLLTPFVIELSYNPIFGDAQELLWLDPSDNTWKNASDGNSNGVAFPVGDAAYDPSSYFHLGDYGIDTQNNEVWAVVDHAGKFAVGLPSVVPEPSTWVSLALGAASFLARRRRR